MNREYVLPTAALRGVVMFPGTTVSFDISRNETNNAVEWAMSHDKQIFLVTQKDVAVDKPSITDLYKIGVVAEVKQYAKISRGLARVMVEVKCRARMVEILSRTPYINALISEIDDLTDENEIASRAFARSIQERFEQYVTISKKFPFEKTEGLKPSNTLSGLADGVASGINTEYPIKQEILETIDVYDRCEKLLIVLKNEIEIADARRKIDAQVKKSIDENQREYYLREEMKVIEKELGSKDGFSEEIEKYREKIRGLGLSAEYEEKLFKETERLSRMNQGVPDSAVTRNYLDTVIELPWNKASEDCLDINKASEILESEHYGLEDVKERVLEHLAVHNLTNGKDGTVLCLSGPPGTGKTSVASSVANALGRKFVRISLGGVHDEAEIRGHRKTYIGSMPGRIVTAIKQAGTFNPLILLDEIDK
ncbi:MAG: LON peptidase substrate-binding domain-containing protein, partial [Clostridia bacterium]|nr:LON peptidase substrate-binding domain-containing protein [Clostridia bacterium]